MKICGYYINLDRAAARRDHMQAEIARLGLPILRQPAVNGADLSDTDWLRQHPRWDLHRLAKPELACFLSHRACWQAIALGDARFGAVFEDDLTFADDAKSFLTSDDWLPVDCDLAKIETTYRMVLLHRKSRSINGRNLARLTSRHLGAGGYIISRTFAARLLHATSQVTVPIDYALFDPAKAVLPKAVIYQLSPAICVQQVRAREVFLPQGAEWSDLNIARRALKLRGIAKLRRELTRPFSAVVTFAFQTMRAGLTGRRWMLIRYRK